MDVIVILEKPNNSFKVFSVYEITVCISVIVYVYLHLYKSWVKGN